MTQPLRGWYVRTLRGPTLEVDIEACTDKIPRQQDSVPTNTASGYLWVLSYNWNALSSAGESVQIEYAKNNAAYNYSSSCAVHNTKSVCNSDTIKP